MSSARVCGQCGAEVSGYAAEGLCPKCMLLGGLDLPDAEPANPPAATTGSAKSEIRNPKSEIGKLRYFGDYELVEEIARGGMGVVYKARQVTLNRIVAVKMILAGQLANAAALQRFLAEAEAAANLHHPNIVAIYEVGEHDGQHYFSMEYVEGQNLSALVREKPLSAAQAARYVRLIAEAIQYAHERGTLHRDLKPSNVLLDSVDQPRITDFGLAKQYGVPPSGGPTHQPAKAGTPSELTLSGQVLGTPSFMPPEQATGQRSAVGPRSDVYSLGAILYHLVTGRPPFAAATVTETLRLVEEAEPVSPRLLNPSVRHDLETICLKCLEKIPARRYATAQALADELGRFLRDEPIQARPVSAPEKFWRWCRRKPALAGMGAVAVLAVALGFVGVIWQLQRVEAQRQRADAQRGRTDAANLKLEIQRAESFLGAGDVPRGLAQMARLLRQHPTNQLLAERLFSALNQRDFPLPVTEPLEHQAPVRDAQFSPDGLRVVTASEDKTARVWDAVSGRPLTRPLRHEGVVGSASFSPDGQWVLTAAENAARVWNARTGEPVGAPLQHTGAVMSARFSPDGKRVVTASRDHTACVWETSSGRLLATVRADARILYAEFSPDGHSLATAVADGAARIWNARTGEPVTPPLAKESERSWVQRVHFSPDALHVATSDRIGDTRIWNAQTGQPVGSLLPESVSIGSAQFSPDGHRLLTVLHTIARVWDFPPGQQLVGPLKHNAEITSAEFSADGLLILTASKDKTAVVWDAHSGQPLCQPIRQGGGLNAAHFSPDGQRVVTASSDKTARVWDVRHGQPFPQSIRAHMDNGLWRFGGMAFAHFSPDGQKLLSAARGSPATQEKLPLDGWAGDGLTNVSPSEAKYSRDGQRIVTISGSARIWDANTLQLLTGSFARSQPLDPADPNIHSVEFSPDGKRVVTTSADKTALISDVETGKPVAKALRHQDTVDDAEFNGHGRAVVTASRDGTARVWDALTGEPLTEPLRHDAWVNRARFSPDGKRVLTASVDETARVWDATTGRELFRLRHDNNVMSAEFSPDGTRILTASLDTTAHVWDAQTGQPLGDPLKHKDRINSARFSPDGERVITASADHTARLWSARTGQPLSDPFMYNDTVNSAEFSPDGAQVVMVSEEGRIDIWEVPSTPLPVPDWLPALAESLAGQRVTENGLVEPDFRDELLKLKERLSKDSRKDVYSRWAKWFFADRTTRTTSAYSKQLTDVYLAVALWSETLSSHREMARLWHTNGVILAQLTAQMMKAGYSISNTIEEAEFLNRRAIQLSPTEAECWGSWAATLDRMGRLSQALEANDRALQLKPTSHRCYNRKGLILEKTNRLEEAYQCFSKAIELKEANPKSPRTELTQYRSNRCELLKRMGRWPEAVVDNLIVHGIRRRDPRAKVELLDLSAFYNVNLTNEWRLGYNLGYHGITLPPGLHRLAGVDFDVRGVVQVAITDGPRKLFPNEVRSIPVGRALSRIHFLHADVVEDSETKLKTGNYLVHFADGQQQEIPLFNGKEIGAWFDSKYTDAEVAWEELDRHVATQDQKVHLYKFTWQNPRPQVEVRSLDVISAVTNAAPFVVAITVE